MIALVRLIFNTPWMMIAVLVAGVGVFGFYKGWSIEHEAKIVAVAARDAAWQKQIGDATADAEQKIVVALAAAHAVTATPSGKKELVTLCAKDPSCRK
jgi:hypothetical protein